MGGIRHVFYLSGDHPAGYAEARILVGSLRRVGVTELVQHTDGVSKAVDGVQMVRVERGADEPMLAHRYRMMCGEVESVSCDTDMIFLENLDEVLEKDFEVAMPLRGNSMLRHRVTHEKQRHNGFVVCRNPGFWRDAHAEIVSAPWKSEWRFADRSYTVAARGYRLLELPYSLYNYQPRGVGEDVRGKKVLHFKAWRKELMSAYNP